MVAAVQRHVGLNATPVSALKSQLRFAASVPAVLLTPIFGYATGWLSSRNLERATADPVAFRFITGNEHPDRATIASSRRRFLKQLDGVFGELLKLARETELL